MSTENISTVILSSQGRFKELMSLYLKEYGGYEVLDDFSSDSELYNTLSSIQKSFLIVDTDDDANMDFIARVSSDCPNCKILAVSENPTVDFIIKVMRLGAKEILSSPVIKSEFFDVLKRVCEQLNGEYQKINKCRMITVFSNKGGIGKTSVASNLALELAKTTKENVALIDLNFQLGDITTFLDLKPSFNISYMLKNLDKINKDFLLNTLEKYKNTSLYVLADPPYFKQADDISSKQVARLFDILKDSFSYIVVDTDANFDGKTITALDNSDLLFLVTCINLPALRNCQRCLDLFDKLGYSSDKVQVLVNRYMENDEIKADDAEKVLNKEIYWKIPNNYFTMMAAINKGVPVSEINPASNVAQSYKELAIHVSDSIHRRELIKKYTASSVDSIDNILRG
ncbi:TPA: AAA family ATPase [Candidatus Scatousia excrementigallinarum]|uniref:AAA family ATPase n=1 Tax=Candidatus Scatousia excrementigallinarum TaxID=2840935 RepID=A0A9D1JMQ7_9BACT|nr:AAA family ATPase [Candidatus Scatousia excrementigallinarum]